MEVTLDGLRKGLGRALAVIGAAALLWTAYVLLTPEPGDMLPVRLAEEPAGGLVREQL